MFKFPDGSLRSWSRVCIASASSRSPVQALPEGQPRAHQGGIPADQESRCGGWPRACSALPEGRGALPTLSDDSAPRFEHPGPGPPGRLRRGQPALAEHDPEAGDAGDARGARAPGAAQQGAGEGPRGAGGRQQDPEPGEDRAAEEPARVLPARADEGHPEGARRRRRPAARVQRAARQDRSGGDAGGGEEGSRPGAGPALQDVTRRRRVHRGADVPGLAGRPSVEHADGGRDRPRQGQGGPGQRPLRPREGKERILEYWPCAR